MTSQRRQSKLIATALLIALPGLLLPVSGGDTASVTGAVLSAGGEAPLSRVTVHLGDPLTGQVFSSSPTSDAGAFHIDGLPAATYEVAVESEGGLYLVDTPLSLEPGVNRAVHLAINPSAQPSAAVSGALPKGRSGAFDNPLTASLIVVGAAILIGVLIDSNSSSTSAPAATSPFN